MCNKWVSKSKRGRAGSWSQRWKRCPNGSMPRDWQRWLTSPTAALIGSQEKVRSAAWHGLCHLLHHPGPSLPTSACKEQWSVASVLGLALRRRTEERHLISVCLVQTRSPRGQKFSPAPFTFYKNHFLIKIAKNPVITSRILHVCVYACVCMFTCLGTHTCIDVYVWLCIHVYMHAYGGQRTASGAAPGPLPTIGLCLVLVLFLPLLLLFGVFLFVCLLVFWDKASHWLTIYDLG